MITGINLIDLLLSYADDLSRACRGIVDLLSYAIWTQGNGEVITLGSLIFGVGIPAFVGVVVFKWVGDILPG